MPPGIWPSGPVPRWPQAAASRDAEEGVKSYAGGRPDLRPQGCHPAGGHASAWRRSQRPTQGGRQFPPPCLSEVGGSVLCSTADIASRTLTSGATGRGRGSTGKRLSAPSFLLFDCVRELPAAPAGRRTGSDRASWGSRARRPIPLPGGARPADIRPGTEAHTQRRAATSLLMECMDRTVVHGGGFCLWSRFRGVPAVRARLQWTVVTGSASRTGHRRAGVPGRALSPSPAPVQGDRGRRPHRLSRLES